MPIRTASRGWAPAALLGVVVLLVGSARPWLRASSDDAVVGAATLTITGSDLSRAVPAAALLGGAALLAGLVGSPVVRRLAGACLLLAAVVAGFPVLHALRDPASAAQPALQERTAITGAVDSSVRADPTWMVYLALVAVLALALAGLLRLLPAGSGADGSATRDPGLVVGESADRGRPAGPEGYGSEAWDRLSAGEDPTSDDGAPDDPAPGAPARDDPTPQDPGPERP